ncbi:hypothetical protein [Achromobacter ruhlandii]|uniref:hypothetical protein n=1 Tax=Achromobacter ruhlandii TaxID=72557 RepID=UPI000A6D2C4D|nr:hypothetical protein [Achromobacter ruhlandii]
MHTPDPLNWGLATVHWENGEVSHVLCVPLEWLNRHDPDDTRTSPAPGAIQIGPLDVP